MSTALFFLGLLLICHQAVSLKQHVSGSSFAGHKFELDLQMDANVLEIESLTPVNAPDNFRETTSRYYFSRQLVAHKDRKADRCYLQRTKLTREMVERRLSNVNDTGARSLGVEEEWINPAKAFPINQQMLTAMFGPEVAEFCRFEQALYLGDGSYGTHGLSPPGLRRLGSSINLHYDVILQGQSNSGRQLLFTPTNKSTLPVTQFKTCNGYQFFINSPLKTLASCKPFRYAHLEGVKEFMNGV